MSHRLLLYGATGFTGELIARQARQMGLQPLLAGRSQHRLEPLARELGCEFRTLALDQPGPLLDALAEVDVVLHAAGPYLDTAWPMVNACLQAGVHYLDLTGERPVFERLLDLDDEARERGLTVMPGVGLIVAATDWLAVELASRLPGSRKLFLGISRSMHASRGSLRTTAALSPYGIKVRRNGVLVNVEPGGLSRSFDYGDGPRPSLVAAWPDVVTAWHSTGIPTIETYLETGWYERGLAGLARWSQALGTLAVWQPVTDRVADCLPEGPNGRRRAEDKRVVVAEVEMSRGNRSSARLITPESYDFSARSAVWFAKAALAGGLSPGFQTPGPHLSVDDLSGLGCRVEVLAD
jgi:short subunit dehydrogenase-like uncharacterized protein